MQYSIELFPLLFGETLSAYTNGVVDFFVDAGGDRLALLGEKESGAVAFARFLLAEEQPSLFEIRNRAGNGGSVLVAQQGELGGGETLGMLAQKENTADEGALQSEFLRFELLDLLYGTVDPADADRNVSYLSFITRLYHFENDLSMYMRKIFDLV
ncbi:MAG: hypothetical protein ACI4U2_03790 [Christensenellaceae bacterium]